MALIPVHITATVFWTQHHVMASGCGLSCAVKAPPAHDHHILVDRGSINHFVPAHGTLSIFLYNATGLGSEPALKFIGVFKAIFLHYLSAALVVFPLLMRTLISSNMDEGPMENRSKLSYSLLQEDPKLRR